MSCAYVVFGGIFQDCAVAKFKMASRSGGGQKGKSNFSGFSFFFWSKVDI